MENMKIPWRPPTQVHAQPADCPLSNFLFTGTYVLGRIPVQLEANVDNVFKLGSHVSLP